MLERGYVTLARVKGVPIRLHWTLPLGVLFLSGARFAPGLWAGVLLILVLHEAGHALVVHRLGLVNVGIDLTGFGGRCRWAGEPTPIERALVAWGGVLAQLVVLVPALAAALLLELPPSGGFAADFLDALVRANAILVAINLLPVRPLDGAEAWPLFGRLWRVRARRRAWKKKLDTPRTLREALAAADAEREANERRRRS